MAGIAAPSVGLAEVMVAQPADDADLRRMLRTSFMPGAVRVAFTREPDYFAADGIAGGEDVTVVARRDGRLVGSGRCSIYALMRNGVSQRIGYLNILRVEERTPESVRLLREGYDLLGRETAHRADGYFTSIASDNLRARRVLEHGGRLGLPSYRRLCDLVTLVAPVVADARPPQESAATESELGDFLWRASQESQLALSWEPSRWSDLARHGVSANDFSVVRQGGRIVAAAAVWDQRAFRQTVIDGYEGWLRGVRPVLNVATALRRGPPLPVPGSVLAQGALLGAGTTDPAAWPALWRLVRQRAAALGLSWLTLSRDARDPELSILRGLIKGQEYRTTLYEVSWPGGPRWSEPWDDRFFRPEVALL